MFARLRGCLRILLLLASLLPALSQGGGWGALTATPVLANFNTNYALIDQAIPTALSRPRVHKAFPASGTSVFLPV